MGGLGGDLLPTEGIPLACPKGVAVTDDWFDVADWANCRLLRIRTTFQLGSSRP